MYMDKSSSQKLMVNLLVVFMLGCTGTSSVQNHAPDVSCKRKYIAASGTGFNLLEQIDIQPSRKGKTHLSIQGTVDNATHGEYSVMLSAYDDIGNMTIRNIKVFIVDFPIQQETIYEDMRATEPEEAEAIETPVPVPASTPVPQSKPSANMPIPDPYTQERQDCISSYGTWNGSTCIWSTPEPAQAHSDSSVDLPSGGSTNCWQEGNMTVCEWVGDWEEYYD